MDVIVIETEAFYALLEKAMERLQPNEPRLNKWIDAEEAMSLLGVAKTTLQNMRNNGDIEFSKINSKTILYNRFSIEQYIENNKSETF
ncbi:MAG: helix-turn-helix domain-containing protein [Cyclobacteriaceae bacterium]